MHRFKFETGIVAKDTVTGFIGRITGRVNYLTGCDQYVLTPEAKDNKVDDGKWFDETRLIIVNDHPFTLPGAGAGAKNGPGDPAPTK